MSSPSPVLWRIPLLALAFASLFVGIATGLSRFGLITAPWTLKLAAAHGVLMVSGFFGTVISLERAVAAGRTWAYLAPLCSAVSVAAILLGVGPPALPAAFAVAGSASLFVVSAVLHTQQRELFTLTLTIGAACWLLGNVFWFFGQPIYTFAPAWLGFLVLTIAGERLELSRVLPPSSAARRVFLLAAGLLIVGLMLALGSRSTGELLFGAGLLMIAAWLARQDIARRTVKSTGLPRFIAVCLLSGYVWLALAGAIIVATGGFGVGTTLYDAALHAVLLGFVFSMVFGHAPIILPAILRVRLPYSALFYVPLALLHASLVLRLIGDIAVQPHVRLCGGVLNAVALIAFVLNTIAAVIRGASQNAPKVKLHESQ